MKIKISNLVGMKIDTVISIAFFFYIITFELWIWIKRWNRKLSFNIFDDLDEKYYLKKKENAIQKEIIE
jgi:hypothetical protein